MTDVREFVKEQREETADWITDKFLDILADRIKHLDEQVAFERGINWGAMELIDKLDTKLNEYENQLDAQESFVPEITKIHIELDDDQVSDFQGSLTSQGFRVLNYHSIQGIVNFFGKAAYGEDGKQKFVFYIMADELWLDSLIDVLNGAKI